MKKDTVLMLGTDYNGQGGIASVIQNYRQSGLFEQENIIYVATHGAGGWAKKLAISVRALIKVLACLASANVSIMHVHSASNASFARKSLFLLLGRIAGIKTIFHLHGGGFVEFYLSQSLLLTKPWIRHTLKQSTAVLALSDSWAKKIQIISPHANVRVIPNTVSVPDRNDQSIKSESPQLNVLYLGKVHRLKGVYDLVFAMKHVTQVLPDAVLKIAGDGDLHALQCFIDNNGLSNNIQMLGWVGPDQRNTLLQQCSIFALPSYHEGLPIALLEAMACARAIVTTPVGAIPEVIEHNINGVLIEPAAASELADALCELLLNPMQRQRLGANAYKHVKQHYSTTLGLSKLRAVYSELRLSNSAMKL